MSNPSKLSFSSTFRYERVVKKGSISFSVGAFGVNTFSAGHNLGYKPYYKAYYTYIDSKYFALFAGTGSYAIDGNGGQIDDVYVDTINFYVTISENNGNAISGTIYYRLYAEPQV